MDKIRLKGIRMEDFCNYKKPSMFLITCFCNWKCCTELGLDVSVCQNEPMARQPIKEFEVKDIFNAYTSNDITKSIIIGGLEPLHQIEELVELIDYFRSNDCNDEFVIYTGFTEEEVLNNKDCDKLLQHNNLIFKFGRFRPNEQPHYDEVLGINLASSNQYGKKIS